MTAEELIKTYGYWSNHPEHRLEDWKYTNVAPIVKTPFKRAEQACGTLPVEPLEPFTLEKVACAQLVFVNGH